MQSLCCAYTNILLAFIRLCQRYVAIKEPLRRAYKQVVNMEFDTVCDNGEKCTKTRPGYKTTYRTVYRTTYKCASDLVE